jgi:hypothetical protein
MRNLVEEKDCFSRDVLFFRFIRPFRHCLESGPFLACAKGTDGEAARTFDLYSAMGKANPGDCCKEYFPMGFLVGSILLWYSSFMASFFPGYMKIRNAPQIGNPNTAVPFVSTLFSLFGISFMLAHFVCPGRVPSKFPWDPTKERVVSKNQPAQMARQIERKMDGSPRYCRICGKYKPDRAHHCRQCGVCTLEMDHHCPYIRNCVGFLNHKYFFLCLFYGACTLVAYIVIMRAKFVHAIQRPLVVLDVLIIFVWFFGIAMSCVIVPFFGFHCYLTYKAYTTLEFCEKLRAKDDKRYKNGQKVKDVYKQSLFEKGLYGNICHVLGPNPLFWLLPVRWGMPLDGTRIPVERKSLLRYYKAMGLNANGKEKREEKSAAASEETEDENSKLIKRRNPETV